MLHVLFAVRTVERNQERNGLLTDESEAASLAGSRKNKTSRFHRGLLPVGT